MPKTSTAALAIVPPRTRTTRLSPPSCLSPGALAVFRETVASVDAAHFTRADLPLLVEFSRAADLADQAAAQIERDGAVIGGRASPWLVVQEKAQRALVALSARLRLSPQSRFDRLKAGTNARRPGERGIEALMDLDDD